MLPFRVARNSVKTLVEQTLDGLRAAIMCGYYRPGDVLPPMRVLTEQLGVSRIVTNEVILRLKREGLINSRPRVGCVVLGHREKLWRGRVLVVNPVGDDNYYNNVFAGVIRDVLTSNGYLFLSCTVPQLDTREYDLSILRHFLQRSIDLVVLCSTRPEVVEVVARSGVRHAVISQFGLKVRPDGDCAFAAVDWNAVMDEFVADVRSAGIRTVEQVSWTDSLSDAIPALRAAGIAARRWTVRADPAVPRIQSVREAGYRAFARRLSSRHAALPDLVYFTDDNLAEGALLAMAERGVRVPEDVSVVSWANYGSGPICAKPLTRMEMHPFADGQKAAGWLLDLLDNRPGGRLVLGPAYIRGKTILSRNGSTVRDQKRTKS